MLAPLPTNVDLTQEWNVRYFAEKFGVSRGRIAQAVGIVGPEAAKLKKYFDDGHRIVIRDESGVARQVARITVQSDGFGVSVPYHPAKEGWVMETPLNYERRDFELGETFVPVREMKHYHVTDTVKLSFHASGFVQFSRGGQKPIVSGYNAELDQVRGAGMRAPGAIRVTSGPLFGIILQDLSAFEVHNGKHAEVFEQSDLWYHPEYPTRSDAYNLEAFMLPGDLREAAQPVAVKRMLTRRLPFYSRFEFSHELRVVELPGLTFILGLILSPAPSDPSITTGYKLGGPGCRGTDGEFKGIAAWYPPPPFVAETVAELNPTSLDYHPPEPTDH